MLNKEQEPLDTEVQSFARCSVMVTVKHCHGSCGWGGLHLLKSGLFGMHTSTAAFSIRPFLEACAHCQKVQQQLCSLKVGVTAAAIRDSWDHAALRHQLHDVGPTVHDAEAGQCPQWKDITHQSHLHDLLGLMNPLTIKRKTATESLGVHQWRV